jgi:hypothetical protein
VVGIFRPNRIALAAYAGLIALSAYFGSIAMISGLLPVGPSLAERLPFHSPVFGGIALALIVGLPTSLVAVLSWRRHPRTPDATALAGLMLVGWIAAELAITREFSALQVVYAAAGAGLIALGNVAILRQVADVVAALPLFVTAPLWRHWHLHWGATPAEVAAAMPGDELVPVSHFTATRAVTINASPAAVWPWLLQVGYLRAGFYSYDLLDNLGRPSAKTILPQWQHLHRGDVAAPMANPPAPATSFVITQADPPEQLVWVKPDSTWCWTLQPMPDGRTRLVTRLRQRYRVTGATAVTVILAEFGDFPMMRRMLLGIKQRAETATNGRTSPRHFRYAPRQQEAGDVSTGQARAAAAGPDGIDLYWLPLGAGGHSVRWNGKLYEALAAWLGRRPSQGLYHSALEVRHGGRRYVIEMAPVWNEASPNRGVVCEGPVGARWLGRFRAFRYEVRCWAGGRIPDALTAVDSPQRLSDDPATVVELLQRAREVPALTWGRDELGAGEMWNSNSLVAWLLAGSGHDMTAITPPARGRAPGWAAGLQLARRGQDSTNLRHAPPARRP